MPRRSADHAARELRGRVVRPGPLRGDGDAFVGRARARRRADRRRRAVVQGSHAGRRRRRTARFRPHHLSLGHSDGAHARGPAVERGDAVGGPEVPRRPLSAVRLEGVQPRGHLSQRRARARGRQARGGVRGDGRLPARAPARAQHHRARRRLEAVGPLRSRARSQVDRWRRRAARRRCASDAAMLRAGRLHGARRRRMPGGVCGGARRRPAGGTFALQRAARAAHHARPAAVARDRPARLSSGGRACGAARQHHAREGRAGVVRRAGMAVRRPEGGVTVERRGRGPARRGPCRGRGPSIPPSSSPA